MQGEPDCGERLARANPRCKVVVSPAAAHVRTIRHHELEHDAGVVGEATPKTEVERHRFRRDTICGQQREHLSEVCRLIIAQGLGGKQRSELWQHDSRCAAQHHEPPQKRERLPHIRVLTLPRHLAHQPLGDLLRRATIPVQRDTRLTQQGKKGISIRGHGRARDGHAHTLIFRKHRRKRRVDTFAAWIIAAHPLHAPHEPVTHALIEMAGSQICPCNADMPKHHRRGHNSRRTQGGECGADHLRVRTGTTRAHQLHPELGQLPRRWLTGSLMPKNGTMIRGPHRERRVCRDRCAHHRSGKLRAQAQFTVAGAKREHLLYPLLTRRAQE